MLNNNHTGALSKRDQGITNDLYQTNSAFRNIKETQNNKFNYPLTTGRKA